MSQKHKIHFFSASREKDNYPWLPYASALIWAFCEKDDWVQNTFQVGGYFPFREDPEDVMAQVENPTILAFSNYMWNWKYHLYLAEQLKQQYPQALVVFGGPQVPNQPDPDFFNQNPFVDILVHGEGELTFLEILKNYPEKSWKGIQGISHAGVEGEVITEAPRPRIEDLDTLPSPMLGGYMDHLLPRSKNWCISQEMSRGCPFKCSFCDWGLIDEKIKKWEDSRCFKELEWIAKNKVDVVWVTDANFGVLPSRDEAMADRAIELNKEFGYPREFTVQYTKNPKERVLRMAEKLYRSNLGKAVNIAVQTMTKESLKAIDRENISLEKHLELFEKARQLGIPASTDTLLGLPGESLESYRESICQLFELGQHDSILGFFTYMLPNAPLNSKASREKFQIQTKSVPLANMYGLKNDYGITELTEIIVATDKMPFKDFQRALFFKSVALGLHSYGPTQMISRLLNQGFGLSYLDFYTSLESAIWEAKDPNSAFWEMRTLFHDNLPWKDSFLSDRHLPEYCKNMVREDMMLEMIMTIVAAEKRQQVFKELFDWLIHINLRFGLEVDQKCLEEICDFANLSWYDWRSHDTTEKNFNYNFLQMISEGQELRLGRQRYGFSVGRDLRHHPRSSQEYYDFFLKGNRRRQWFRRHVQSVSG